MAEASPQELNAGQVEEVNHLRRSVAIIFGAASRPDMDLYLVYSSHPMRELLAQDNVPIDLKPTAIERRLVTFQDAQGIAKIQGLLYQAGKDQRLHPATSSSLPSDYWEHHLVLVGSKLANQKTEKFLKDMSSPLFFSADNKYIRHVSRAQGPWPGPDDGNTDFGILVKMKQVRHNGGNSEIVYLAVAGLTSHATRACCDYLVHNIQELADEFRTSQFAILIAVDRDGGIPRRVLSAQFN